MSVTFALLFLSVTPRQVPRHPERRLDVHRSSQAAKGMYLLLSYLHNSGVKKVYEMTSIEDVSQKNILL